MTTLELIPVILALCLWGSKLANMKVPFHIDNQALVTIISKANIQVQKGHVSAPSFCNEMYVE